MWVSGDLHSFIFYYTMNVLISLSFKVGKYEHVELDVFSELYGVNLQVEYRKSASLIKSEMGLSSNVLTNQ